MLTGRRRPDAPPPPKPVSAADPTAPTTQEWREAEREKAAQRKAWVLRFALLLSLPFLAGGAYAFWLVYLWRVLCVRVPLARRCGVLWAVPALAACSLFPQAVLGPTRELVELPVVVGWEAPVVAVVPLPGLPLEVGVGVGVADPFPPLRGHLTASWKTGLVWAALLCAGWGVGGFLEGAKLKPRSAVEVLRAAERGLKARTSEIQLGLLLRGYITMLYGRQGLGKTELICWLIRRHRKLRIYWLTEQTDATLAPYLERWGLDRATRLHIVTRDKADALWKAHGHDTAATWDHLGPMVLNDAGRRGTDVFVMDTWTAWTGGTQDAKGIQAAMAPIRAAVGRWGFAQITLGHTNKEGQLLGSKEFERLCDISVGGEVVEGTEVRRLTWVKDRSPANLTGRSLDFVRDLAGAEPEFRPPTPAELAGAAVAGAPKALPAPTSGGGGFGGNTRKGLVDLSSQRHPVGRRLRKAGAEGCTVSELTSASGLTQQAVALWLKAREQEKQCERFAKRGNADVWRFRGGDDVGAVETDRVAAD